MRLCFLILDCNDHLQNKIKDLLNYSKIKKNPLKLLSVIETLVTDPTVDVGNKKNWNQSSDPMIPTYNVDDKEYDEKFDLAMCSKCPLNVKLDPDKWKIVHAESDPCEWECCKQPGNESQRRAAEDSAAMRIQKLTKRHLTRKIVRSKTERNLAVTRV